MRFSRSNQTLTAWIALIAILMGLFAPSVTQALAIYSSEAPAWQEICTLNGIKWISSDGEDLSSSPSTPSSFLDTHCPYCISYTGHTFGLLTQTYNQPALPPEHAVPHPDSVTIHPGFFSGWPTSPPRAPPHSESV